MPGSVERLSSQKRITIHPFKNFDEWGPIGDQLEHNTFIIPQPETKRGLDELEETMQLPGIKVVFVMAEGPLSCPRN